MEQVRRLRGEALVKGPGIDRGAQRWRRDADQLVVAGVGTAQEPKDLALDKDRGGELALPLDEPGGSDPDLGDPLKDRLHDIAHPSHDVGRRGTLLGATSKRSSSSMAPKEFLGVTAKSA